MNLFIYHLLVFVLTSIKPGHSNPGGAPVRVCASMIPNHGNTAPQQCSSKYTVESDKSEYYASDTVHITVRGSTNNDQFKGILLIAKTITSEQIIGTWTTTNANIKTLSCNDIANTGITHNSASDKSSIDAVWYPPSTATQESTVIKATIVQSYSEIYVDCFSITLTAKTDNPTTTGAKTTSSTDTVVSNYTGTTSNTSPSNTSPSNTSPSNTSPSNTSPSNTSPSNTSPSNTSPSNTSPSDTSPSNTSPITSPSDDAGVIISWTYDNGVTVVKMEINNLKTSQWLALGLSLDDKMGEDHVFVCKRLSTDKISVDRLANPRGTSPPVLASTMSNLGGTLTSTSLKFDSGVAYCEFTLSNFSGSKRRRRRDISPLSQSTTYIPLIAIGDLDSSNNMIMHTSRIALSEKVQLNKQTTISYKADSIESARTSLMKAHAVIMIFTWLFYVPLGILMALYFKKTWPDRKVCGKPIWFAVHRALMTVSAVLTIIAFMLVVAYKKGKWIPQEEKLEFNHSVIGIIVVCFTLIQLIMALYRCEHDEKYRYVFNYTHGFVGLMALIFSAVAMFLAIRFPDFNFTTNAEWGILAAWVCWVFLMFVIFWFMGFFVKKNVSKKATNASSYELGNQYHNGSVQTPPTEGKNNGTPDWIKGTLISVHTLVTFALALALAILVGKA
ncbi:unnamed protein product [Rotaria sp. Silwood2]|nr:unnamed protein product [Rotaria sp. Silwood2]